MWYMLGSQGRARWGAEEAEAHGDGVHRATSTSAAHRHAHPSPPSMHHMAAAQDRQGDTVRPSRFSQNTYVQVAGGEVEAINIDGLFSISYRTLAWRKYPRSGHSYATNAKRMPI